MYGEYVPDPCTHCLSSQPSRVMMRAYLLGRFKSLLSEAG